MPAYVTQPFLADPRAVSLGESFLFDDDEFDGGASDVEPVLMCTETCARDDSLLAGSCTRSVCSAIPSRTVSFPWGEVQYPWPGGRTLSTYDTGVDNGVFVMLDEFCGVSLDSSDDPTWERAIKGNDSQEWWEAGYDEMRNLERFGVVELVAADAIDPSEDIYDTMNVC